MKVIIGHAVHLKDKNLRVDVGTTLLGELGKQGNIELSIFSVFHLRTRIIDQ